MISVVITKQNNKYCNVYRQGFLRDACKIPGIYVPSLYEVTYKESDGTIESFKPIYDDVPATIVRQVVADMDNTPYPTKMLIPFVRAIQDRVVLEIQRGCIRGCRFCQAGMIYRPNREKSVDILKKQAKELLASTGHEEISLSSQASYWLRNYGRPVNVSIGEMV